MLSLGDYSSSELYRFLPQVGLGIGLSATVYSLNSLHFRSLFSYFFRKPGKDGWNLDFEPSEIGWADRVFFLVAGVLNKTVRGLFGGGLRIVKGQESVELPSMNLRCPVEVADEQYELYNKALTHDQKDMSKVDAGSMAGSFLLATLTNQMMLLLVVHPGLPVSPLGAVNVRNRIECHQHPLDLTRSLTAHAFLGGKDNLGRVTRRGIEFDIHIDVSQTNSSSTLVLRQMITILAHCKTKVPPPSTKANTQESNGHFEEIGKVEMPLSAPARWSAVCGDYNPIHVSSLLARLFGFRGKIAHGNHVVAKVLHHLTSHTKIEKGWWVETEFKRPMVLPIQLTAQSDKLDGKRWRCIGDKDDKVYVSGSVGRL